MPSTSLFFFFFLFRSATAAASELFFGHGKIICGHDEAWPSSLPNNLTFTLTVNTPNGQNHLQRPFPTTPSGQPCNTLKQQPLSDNPQPPSDNSKKQPLKAKKTKLRPKKNSLAVEPAPRLRGNAQVKKNQQRSKRTKPTRFFVKKTEVVRELEGHASSWPKMILPQSSTNARDKMDRTRGPRSQDSSSSCKTCKCLRKADEFPDTLKKLTS